MSCVMCGGSIPLLRIIAGGPSAGVLRLLTVVYRASQAARLGEFPWMVALRLVSSSGKTHRSKYLCGGSLIAPDIVLTAAHCIFE